MERNLFLDHDDNVGKNICNNNIVALISRRVLCRLIVDDISLDHTELFLRDIVGCKIFMNCGDGVLIEIRSKYILRTKL